MFLSDHRKKCDWIYIYRSLCVFVCMCMNMHMIIFGWINIKQFVSFLFLLLQSLPFVNRESATICREISRKWIKTWAELGPFAQHIPLPVHHGTRTAALTSFTTQSITLHYILSQTRDSPVCPESLTFPFCLSRRVFRLAALIMHHIWLPNSPSLFDWQPFHFHSHWWHPTWQIDCIDYIYVYFSNSIYYKWSWRSIHYNSPETWVTVTGCVGHERTRYSLWRRNGV